MLRFSSSLCIFIIISGCALTSLAYPQGQPQTSAAIRSEGYSKPKLDGYFQYVNVPGPKEYEFGWNRGNPNHFVSRYEQSKDHKFRTRVRWGDKKDGYGEHYFEYNHGPQEYKSAPSAVVYKEAPAYKEAPVYKEPPPTVPVYKPAATESVYVPTYTSSS